MAVQGHVDHMEGGYVTGWAIAMPDTGNCDITVLDMQGNLLAKGRAARYREDLAGLGFGRGNLGFRVAVPQAAMPRGLRVMANGEELGGSPLITGPGLFDGQARLEGDGIIGWVSERVGGFAAPFVTILNHLGIEVGRGQSAFSADDTDPLFAPARFAITLDDQCFGAGEMLLTLRANATAFASLTCHLGLTGHIDHLSETRCAGWLSAPEAPRRCFALEVYRDGQCVATARNDVAREDMADPAGFDIALAPPVPHAPMTPPVSLSLRFAGCARELFEGPYLLAGQAAVVSAAQRAARLAHLDLPGIGPAERAVLTEALGQYMAQARQALQAMFTHQPASAGALAARRLVIIIPIYRGVEVTHGCIAAVLAHRDAGTDQLILINDASPEPLMAAMLLSCTRLPNVVVLTNAENLGFVRSVNRGLGMAAGADVLLLNSDTVLHEGGLAELKRVAAAPGIGTVTAMSSNATIFSYPHPDERHAALEDISWPELAAIALACNAGMAADVPTGHGFCMFINAGLLRRIGHLDEAFGRGYGEENDFCARAAALGYRNVAAGGVLVEHKESISFGEERAGLMLQNQPRLHALYPEYVAVVGQFEHEDGLRRLRWGLDRARLKRAVAAGARFVLVVSNALEGGTAKAIRDIEAQTGHGGGDILRLSVTRDGLIELTAEAPLLRARFSQAEGAALLAMLDVAAPAMVMVHQMLGFPADFIAAFGPWAAARHGVFWAHDFYALCPRVTMIDATGRFCNAAAAETCARCVAMGGGHEASALTELTPAAHRALFAGLLGSFTHVVAPSDNAAGYLARVFPETGWEVLPHPELAVGLASRPRDGRDDEIVLLGAIGPHKGSALLLELARLARLTHPHLTFRVIGYTDIDSKLRAAGNVIITGRYLPGALPGLLAEATGRLALFLPNWPETYSYTLSELVAHGFIPLVPDIGAPAERVRAAKYGVVFPFPATPEAVLRTIDDIAAGRVKPVGKGAAPARFFATPQTLARLGEVAGSAPRAAKPAAGLFTARAAASTLRHS